MTKGSTLNNLQVLYEDNHLLVINKRPSDLVQGDKTGDVPLVDLGKAYLKAKYDKPGQVFLGVAHRLDRPVSGAIVFGRTSKALERLNKLFREKTVEKIYWAVVQNRPPKSEDRLVQHLLKNEKQNKSYPVDAKRTGSKEAILNYRLLHSSDRYHLLEIKLKTGRHHQIRAQLADMGCPIRGDLKYGFSRSNNDASIHLHARSISFIHPVQKEPLTLVAEPPADPLWQAFLAMQK